MAGDRKSRFNKLMAEYKKFLEIEGSEVVVPSTTLY